MPQEYRTLIAELWARLKLGTPRFGDADSVTLSTDGIDVALRESPDGRHLIISGIAGRLSADPGRRGEQVRRLLKVNLGLLQSNRAGLSLSSGEEAATVQVQAVYPYVAGDLGQLTGLIEDVLHRLEIHGAELAMERPFAAARPAPANTAFTTVSHEDFIFRP